MFKQSQLTKLYIENFQTIGNYQEIPISPITILVGPNSAGKSGVLDILNLFSTLFRNSLLKEIKQFSYTTIGDELKKNLRFGSEESLIGFQAKFNPKNINRKHFEKNVFNPNFERKTKFIQECFFSERERKNFRNYFSTNFNHDFIIDFKIKFQAGRGVNCKSLTLKIDNQDVVFFKDGELKVYLKNYPFFPPQDQAVIKKFDSQILSFKDIDLFPFRNFEKLLSQPKSKYFFQIIENIKHLCDLEELPDITPASRVVPKQDECKSPSMLLVQV